MTFGKAAALTAGFVGAVALGVAIGPSVTDRMSDIGSSSGKTPARTEEARRAPEPQAAKANPATVARAKADDAAAEPVAIAANAVRPDEPRVQQALKPVLNRGAKMEIAAKGFLTAEEFATVAHASRNTNVPFMVMKHRVLSEKKPYTDTIASTIREFKPELNAKAELARAQREAREDLANLSN
jgi:hypothetical protein